MSIIEACHMDTDLSPVQISLLEQVGKYALFAATISRCEIQIYTKDKDETLLQLYHALPNSSELGRKEKLHLQAYEVPLWAEVLLTGQHLQGKQEYELGQFREIAIFPLIDNGGQVIGGIAFVGQDKEDDFFLRAETAYMTMMVPLQKQPHLYEPLSYGDGVMIVNDKGIILYANEVAGNLIKLLGFERTLIGATIFGGALKLSAIKKALAIHEGIVTEAIYGEVVVKQTLIPVISGKFKRNYLILRDCTMVRKSEQALLVKNSVIKEIHHRVKNNLQTATGILRMQLRRTEFDEVKTALQDSIGRLESMALVHDLVSHYDEEFISLRVIAEELLRLLRKSMATLGSNIYCEYEGEDFLLSTQQATYISLVLNELISNAFKHGLREHTEGILRVEAKQEAQLLVISVIDSGRGVHADFQRQIKRSLGVQIVENLIKNELKGDISFENQETGGLKVTFTSTYEG